MSPEARPPSTSSAQFRAYMKIFCFLSGGILASVGSFNYIVDPYLIHQWDSPLIQRLRPTREKLSPWGKTYAIAKYKPSIVYLGNSRTEAGLPTQFEPFSGKKVFNGALSGASLGDAIAMAKHAASISRLDAVVWGIDYPSFSLAADNTDFDRELVADEGNYSFRRALLNVQRGLAVDMTEDSVKLLLNSFGEVCRSSLAFHGQRDEACFAAIFQRAGGPEKLLEKDIKTFAQGSPSAESAIAGLDLAVREMCNAGIRLRFYINPTHALMLDALFWANKWDAMEAWRRSLVKMVDFNRHSGCDIRLFDFAGFNSITTEKIPQTSGRKEMQNYWETSHYRSNVGIMILKKLFDNNDGSVPSDFGIELNTNMLSLYSEQMRLERDQYHYNHPVETELVRRIVSTSFVADSDLSLAPRLQ